MTTTSITYKNIRIEVLYEYYPESKERFRTIGFDDINEGNPEYVEIYSIKIEGTEHDIYEVMDERYIQEIGKAILDNINNQEL